MSSVVSSLGTDAAHAQTKLRRSSSGSETLSALWSMRLRDPEEDASSSSSSLDEHTPSAWSTRVRVEPETDDSPSPPASQLSLCSDDDYSQDQSSAASSPDLSAKTVQRAGPQSQFHSSKQLASHPNQLASEAAPAPTAQAKEEFVVTVPFIKNIATVKIKEDRHELLTMALNWNAKLSPVVSVPSSEFELRYRPTARSFVRNSLFGKVFSALDLKTGQEVVVKLSHVPHLKKQQSLSGTPIIENPVHEAAIMKKLVKEGSEAHPHVLRLISEHEDSVFHWLVTEFAPAGDVYDFVDVNGPLGEKVARRFFRQLVSGLSHIHQVGICHLDLSLENLLLDDKHHIKISDFGVSRILPPNGLKSPGFRDKKPGKLRYMAPEILRGHEYDGRQADVFNLGVILFSMLIGNPPFERASRSDIRYAMIADARLSALLNVLNLGHLVSDGAIDLLCGLICEAEHRMTLEEISAHPWMNQ